VSCKKIPAAFEKGWLAQSSANRLSVTTIDGLATESGKLLCAALRR
jgi:hypothetical protein